MTYEYKRISIAIIFIFLSSVIFGADKKNIDLHDFQAQNVSLNFRDIKVRSALQLLADFSGVNLVVNDKVQGNISIHLNEMPWQQALDIILETQNLAKRPIKNGWLIAAEADFLERDRKKQKVQKELAAFKALSSKIIVIHYGKATTFEALFKDKKNNFLSTRGSINIDYKTNSLRVRDFKENLDEIENIIKDLDRPTKQVCIEARIVSIDKNKEHELGARFGLRQPPLNISHAKPTYTLGKSSNTLLPQLSMDLPLSVSSANPGIVIGSLGLHLLRLGENIFLDLELSALENEGGAQIISAPHLMTEDQETACIETGASIPYQGKTSTGATNVVFKKAVLSLKVTPRVMPDHRLMLDLEVNQDQPSAMRVLDVPAINARHIKTKVIVKNGETIVLGGIYEHSYTQTEQRIPFLGSIPIIRNLFNYKEANDKRTELLIFVTPTIMDY